MDANVCFKCLFIYDPVWWTAALAELHAYVELVNRRRQRSRLTWLFRFVPPKIIHLLFKRVVFSIVFLLQK